MFKRQVLSLDEVLSKFLREGGLETPLLQKRLIDAWTDVAGPMVERYTGEKYIKNQTLFVKINNPSLRQDLSMMRSQLVKRLNEAVGSFVISDVKVY
jgi:predicted nucleic acid-binding Zn ribbon protein